MKAIQLYRIAINNGIKIGYPTFTKRINQFKKGKIDCDDVWRPPKSVFQEGGYKCREIKKAKKQGRFRTSQADLLAQIPGPTKFEKEHPEILYGKEKWRY